MILDLLEGAECIVKYSQSRRDEIRVCCLFCQERGHPHDERYLLGINLKSGLGYCFHCQWKSGDLRRTLRELCRVLGVDYGVWTSHEAKNQQEKGPTEPKIEPVGLPEGYESFTDRPDRIEKRARAYLTARRISLSQIIRHKIGYAAVGSMAWRVLFPVFGSDGKIYGCVGRTFADGKPKYLNTPNIKLLWGAHRYAATAVIVEGVIDALRVERALLAFRNIIAVARLGNSITNPQIAQLKAYDRVIIFPDHDKAGIVGALKLAEVCSNARMQLSVVVPSCMDDRDPGDMTDQEIVDEVNGAKSWSDGTKKRLIQAMGRRQPRYADQISLGTDRSARIALF